MKTRTATGGDGRPKLLFWCPGCRRAHVVTVDGPQGASPRWTWNGDRDRPTLEPSIHCNPDGNRGDWRMEPRCHSFVREGQIQFLADSQHELAGQTVPIPEWPWQDDPE